VLKPAWLEKIAFNNGWLDFPSSKKAEAEIVKISYRNYL